MKTTISHIALAAVMAAGLAAGIASPSFADVNVTVSIDKDKTISVSEHISINKTVNIHVDIGRVVVLEPGTGNPIGFKLVGLGAAEAQALANVRNQHNTETLEHVSYDAELLGSLSNNTGITQANQAAGNMQNQGNLVAFGATASGDAFANSQAEVDQKNGGVENSRNIVNAKDSIFTANIGAGSLSGNHGILQFNQDSGNNNNQTNAVAVAAGVDDPTKQDVVVALSEAALGQESSNNLVVEGGGTDPVGGPQGTAADSVSKSATISGALNGNSGLVAGVNQAAGNNANQGNVVSIAAYVSF